MRRQQILKKVLSCTAANFEAKMAYSSNSGVEQFESFFRGWLIGQENFLAELDQCLQRCHGNVVSEEEDSAMKELVRRVAAHYDQYYHAKSRLAQHNIFVLFSLNWFTPFEKTFLWIAGFKPGLAFQIVKNFITDLSEEQVEKIEQARVETRMEERDLSEDQARIQETIASPPILEMARRAARAFDEELVDLESSLNELRTAMEMLVEYADCLRRNTVIKLLAILSPAQGVKFFASFARFHLQVRRCGLVREASTSSNSYQSEGS